MLNIFCGGTLPLELQMMDEPAEAALRKKQKTSKQNRKNLLPARDTPVLSLMK